MKKAVVASFGVALVIGCVISAGGASALSSHDSSSATERSAHASTAKRGPRGPRGRRGPAGPRGQSGIAGITSVDSPEFTVQPGDSTVDALGAGEFRVDCPAGSTVIGTGFEAPFGGIWFVKAYGDFVGGFAVNYSSISAEYSLQAICARTSGASAVRAGSDARFSDAEADAQHQAVAVTGR